MTNEVKLLNGSPSEGYCKDAIEAIKKTIAPGLSNDELAVFLYNCKRTGLDPLARQIYAIKRGGRMCIQTGIDGFRLIAERTGKYAPGEDTHFMYDDKGNLLGAKVYIKKMTPDGTWHQVSATAFIQEYSTRNGLWKTLPHVMIEKVAESRCLRRCFPADLSNIYVEEELDQSAIKEVVQPQIDAQISEESFEALDEYLNGHDDLRDKLKELCNVDDLRNIKESQLQACRNYAIQYKKNNTTH